MSIVKPGERSHPVTAMAANRTFGNAEGESSYGLPFEPENIGAGSVYKIFTAATALQQGDIGIASVIPVPPSGYASPIYSDGSGNPIPVGNAGNYAGRLSLTDALAQSPNTAFVKLEETTGVPPVVDMAVNLGLTSLAESPAETARPRTSPARRSCSTTRTRPARSVRAARRTRAGTGTSTAAWRRPAPGTGRWGTSSAAPRRPRSRRPTRDT